VVIISQCSVPNLTNEAFQYLHADSSLNSNAIGASAVKESTPALTLALRVCQVDPL